MHIFSEVVLIRKSIKLPFWFMSKHQTKALLILISAWMFYLYEYILRVSPSVMTNALMTDFGVTSSALGVLVSFYYFAYVPLQIPCGMIVDSWGPRIVITASAAFCTLGTFIFTYSTSLPMAQCGRFLMGAGSACAYLSCAKIASSWFQPHHFAMITCIGMCLGTLGGMIGGMPVASLVNHFGWRSAMFTLACIGLFICIQSWFVIRDKPDSTKKVEKSMTTIQALQGLKLIASNPQSWIIFLYGCMIYLPLSAFAELWGVPFLMKAYTISNDQAAYGTAAVFLGMGVGSIAGAWLSDKIQSRKKIMLGSALGTLAIFSIIFFFYQHISYSAMLGVLLLGGFVNGGQTLYFTSAKEVNPPELSATSIGFTNSGVMLSGIIFQPLLGMIIDAFWNGGLDSHGARLYTVECYQKSCSVILIAFIVAAVLANLIKETYPKREEK